MLKSRSEESKRSHLCGLRLSMRAFASQQLYPKQRLDTLPPGWFPLIVPGRKIITRSQRSRDGDFAILYDNIPSRISKYRNQKSQSEIGYLSRLTMQSFPASSTKSGCTLHNKPRSGATRRGGGGAGRCDRDKGQQEGIVRETERPTDQPGW